MIHCITGKPGGGKTLHAVRLVCEYLRLHSTLRVVTNLPLRLDALNEYLQGFDVVGRVRLLTESEVPEFFLFRGPCLRDGQWVDVKGVPGPGDSVDWPDWADWPVLYVLDEAHQFWNAREWAKTGKRVLWYLSQHRKRGDTVIWVTQHSGNVDKQFRVLTQDFTVCRNMCKETFRGFGMPKRFRVEVGLEPPDTASRVVTEVRMIRPDARLWQLYDTSAGVGLPGGMPPEPEIRRRRPPWWVGVVGILLVVLLVAWSAPRFVGWAVGSLARGVTDSASSVVSSAVRLPSESAVVSGTGSVARVEAPRAPESPRDARSDSDRRTARVTASWVLPDGRVFRAWETSDSAVVAVGNSYRSIPLANRNGVNFTVSNRIDTLARRTFH